MFNGASFRMIAAIGAAGYNPVAYPANWLQVTDYVSPNDIGLGNVDNTSDLNKPISTATQTALDGKANTAHTHVAADITDFNSAVDARIPSIPSTIVSSVNGDTGPDIILDSDDIEEGASNLYFTNERVDDRVSDLLVAGSGISLSYNDSANTLTVTATGVVAGAAKYVRGFSVSGFITSSAAAAMPLIITSNATINSIKAYCKTTGSGVNIDILKNGTSIFTGGYTLNMASSSVVTATSSNYNSSLLTDDILELSVTMAEAGVSKDLVVSIELIS
jgi:hypothetical protein